MQAEAPHLQEQNTINAITSKEAALVHDALAAGGWKTPLRPPMDESDNENAKAFTAVSI